MLVLKLCCIQINYFVPFNHETKINEWNIFREADEKEFTTMCCSPSGQALCVGSYDR